MNTNTTAAERKKAVNVRTKQEQYKDCPTRTTVQVIDGSVTSCIVILSGRKTSMKS